MDDERRARIFLDGINYLGSDKAAHALLVGLFEEVRQEERGTIRALVISERDLELEAFPILTERRASVVQAFNTVIRFTTEAMTKPQGEKR